MRIINIKKYNNRKLYSPKNELFDFGTYVTLKDLEEAIKKGSEIRVIDNDTKQDITSETLRSIIAEMSGNEDKLVKFIRGW